MSVDIHQSAVVRCVAAARQTLVQHHRPPRRVCVVQADIWVFLIILYAKHPRLIRRIKAEFFAGICRLVHHCVLFLRQFRIFLSVRPILCFQVCACFQSINHTHVRFPYVRAHIPFQQFFGLIQVRQDKRPHFLVAPTWVVIQVLVRCFLRYQRRCFCLFV